MINSMSYKGYAASMVFDTEDKIIVGRVLSCPPFFAFQRPMVSIDT